MTIIGTLILFVYAGLIIGSIILLILKIIERNKEKKKENLDKYDDY